MLQSLKLLIRDLSLSETLLAHKYRLLINLIFSFVLLLL